MSTFIELIKFLISKKKFWMIPFMIIFFLLGILLFLSQGSLISPFIYTLF